MSIPLPDLEDLRDEFPRKRRPKYACADRMCGAQDCATCFPFSWDDSRKQSEEEGAE
jgi:hypothetical protein